MVPHISENSTYEMQEHSESMINCTVRNATDAGATKAANMSVLLIWRLFPPFARWINEEVSRTARKGTEGREGGHLLDERNCLAV